MIKQIQLRCFRKHEELNLNLGEGLQTLRAPNEAGKTTILEGATYALFGSKALRNSLAETVTWGRKETELQASVAYEAEGVIYLFKRSKAGAEVYRDSKAEPFVTGQVEVSNFAAGLVGADATVAAHLMMSGQGGLRGVLEQGPKATAGLIETLSDLDLIDRLIEAAGEKLQLGSTAVLTDRLKQADVRLAELVPVPAPDPVDFDKMRADLSALQGGVEKQAPITKLAVDMFNAEVNKREQRTKLERDRKTIEEQAEQTMRDLAIAKDKLNVTVPDVQALQAKVDECDQYEARAREYRLFSKLPTVTVHHNRVEVQKKMAELTSLRYDLKVLISNIKRGIKEREGKITNEHKCHACGQDTSHLEKVKEEQVKLKAELAELIEELPKVEKDLAEADVEFDKLDDILMLDGAVEKAAAGLRTYVTRDSSLMPALYAWVGDVPGDDAPDLVAAQEALRKAKLQVIEYNRAEGQVAALNSTFASLAKRDAELEAKIAEIGVLDDNTFFDLERAKIEAEADLNRCEGLVAMQKIVMEEAERTYNKQEADFTTYKLTKASLESDVETLRKDIETTEFNNQLVKKIRGARPIIANKLWNLVLTTVSTLFSQMRGETSVVAKGKDGFTVNGRPVESLSGSTQDILGLAIRCALIKTFVPACPFLILDEPSAACDADRSAALVGFVAAAGFRQVIMVTHEDVSESLSSNLIQIGE